MIRWVTLEGAYNVRELGGLSAGDRVTASDVLYRGDTLDRVTAGDVNVLTRRLGLRAVVDLRSEAEVGGSAPWMSAHGIAYHHVPLFDLTGEAGSAVRGDLASNVPAAYRRMLALATPAMAEIVSVVADRDAAGGPTLVHCAAGKDRTGIVVAVLLSAVGASDETVITDYLATGERLADVRAALARRAMYTAGPKSLPPFSAAPVETVLTVLREEYGGADGFLTQAGVPESTLHRLRDVMLTDPREATATTA
ncbi:MAG: tyrosine-protein phosphatase [bacterium]|nr:tyrosine-protein phosphatase [bacterium]